MVMGSKSNRELRDGVTQSKLRFESRLGADRWNELVLDTNFEYTVTASRRHQAIKRARTPQQAACCLSDDNCD